MFEKSKEKNLKKYADLTRRMNKQLPEKWDNHFPTIAKDI